MLSLLSIKYYLQNSLLSFGFMQIFSPCCLQYIKKLQLMYHFNILIILIVVFPCMLTIIQLLFQQNAHVFCY
jgi:hypothetical protein